MPQGIGYPSRNGGMTGQDQQRLQVSQQELRNPGDGLSLNDVIGKSLGNPIPSPNMPPMPGGMGSGGSVPPVAPPTPDQTMNPMPQQSNPTTDMLLQGVTSGDPRAIEAVRGLLDQLLGNDLTPMGEGIPQ